MLHMDPSGGKHLGVPMGPPQTSEMPSSPTTPMSLLTTITMGPDGNSVDEAPQHSTLSKESAASGGDDGPSSSNSKNNEDNKSTAGGMTEEKGKSFAEIALGNHLIIKKVFQNLENNDLGSCCGVNEFWRSSADPLYVRHYQVGMLKRKALQHDADTTSEVHLSCWRFKITVEGNKFPNFVDTLEGASEFLLEAAKANKIAISFHSTSVRDQKLQNTIGSFLAKIGEYVTRFVTEPGRMSLSAYREWLQYMPNLIRLDWNGSSFIHESVYPKEKRIRMRSLRIIQVGNLGKEQYVPTVRILKMAPKLEEIWSFPVILWEALVETKKAFFVKSLSFQNTRGYGIQAGFRRMSSLRLKLTEFHLTSRRLCDPDYQPSVRRILNSSRDSLEILSLSRTESFDFQPLPPITSLKVIDFLTCLDSEGENGVGKFFAPNTELQKIFPNVSTVQFRNLPRRRRSSLNVHVNDEQFASWGPQIKHLKLIHISGGAFQRVDSLLASFQNLEFSSILRPMSTLFPSVQHLEFQVSDCGEFGVSLREIGEYWPDVQSLAVKLDTCYTVRTLDSAFTGIPEVAVAQLRDPGLRKDHFSSEEIQNFKEGSVLRKLSKLKILKFHLEGSITFNSEWKLLGKFCAITAVSKEFGFQFLPDLKIVLRTSNQHFRTLSDELEASPLGTLVRYEVEYAGP